MEKMILKMSYWKIFSRLFDIFTVTAVFIAISLTISHFKSDYFAEIFLLLAIMVLPGIILFFEYLIVTQKQQSIVFTDKGLEVFYRNGKSDRLSYDEIEKMKLYKAAGNDKGSFTININENYYFVKIIAKDKRMFVFTSLLGPDLSDALNMIKDIPIDRTKTGYAFTFFR